MQTMRDEVSRLGRSVNGEGEQTCCNNPAVISATKRIRVTHQGMKVP